MSETIYAIGTYEDGHAFRLQFATQAEARRWAMQHRAVITKLWALYERAA